MSRLHPLDVFGLRPFGPALRQSWRALAGDPLVPPSRFGLSSLRILKPWISLPTWLGRRRADRRAPVYLLPNRTPTPPERGYSVRVTQCRDFRGGRLTYDSHLGTDFAVPVGTRVCAAAPGLVRQVRNEMNRGGLKVLLDHGAGLCTTYNHLARASVRPGQLVGRGEPIGRSGMSGTDGVLLFPWLAPHLHFNALLDGEAVDPWAAEGEEGLWRIRNDPRPETGPAEAPPPTAWDVAAVRASAEACRDPQERARLLAVEDPEQQAAEVLYLRFFARSLFELLPPLTARNHPARPVLSLPFCASELVGAALP